MNNWDNRAQSNIGTKIIRFDLVDNYEKKIKYSSDVFHVVAYLQSFNHVRGESIPIHWHDGLQIIWVYEGDLSYSVSDKQFPLNSNEILLINEKQSHKAETIQKNAKTLCINFQLDFLPEKLVTDHLLPVFNKSNFTFAKLAASPILVSRMKSIITSMDDELNYFSIFILISEIIEAFLIDAENQTNSYNNSEDQQLFNSLITFIHNNYHRKITLDLLSQEVLINKNKITQLFQKFVQTSPIQYTNSYRLYLAREKILYSEEAISEISDELGFNNVSYFIEVFRKRFQLSPSKFRRKFSAK